MVEVFAGGAGLHSLGPTATGERVGLLTPLGEDLHFFDPPYATLVQPFHCDVRICTSCSTKMIHHHYHDADQHLHLFTKKRNCAEKYLQDHPFALPPALWQHDAWDYRDAHPGWLVKEKNIHRSHLMRASFCFDCGELREGYLQVDHDVDRKGTVYDGPEYWVTRCVVCHKSKTNGPDREKIQAKRWRNRQRRK